MYVIHTDANGVALENGTMIDVKIRGSSTKWSKRDKYAYFLHKITHSLNYISNDQSQPNANGILRTSLQGKKNTYFTMENISRLSSF